MENKKNGDTLKTIAWIVIIFCVIFLTALLLSGILEVKVNIPKKENKSPTIEQQEETNSNITETNNNLDNEKFSSIIEEYKKAMNDESYVDILDKEEKYPNINTNIMAHYHVYNKDNKMTFDYAYYDINNDGKNELIVATEKSNIVEMYTYDGNKPIRFYNSICLGERCNTKIYDNGIIYFYGSGGASYHSLEFYKIAPNGYSKEVISTYGIEYDENQNITIKQGDKITDFKSDEEIIKSVINSAKEIDLSKLNWNTIEK